MYIFFNSLRCEKSKQPPLTKHLKRHLNGKSYKYPIDFATPAWHQTKTK